MLRQFITSMVDLIYPRVCFSCGNYLTDGGLSICPFCELSLPVTNFHTDPLNEMSRALWGRTEIEWATAYLFFRKSGITQKLLHAIKYADRPELAVEFGSRFAEQIKWHSFIAGLDCLMPVPLHPSKLRARGYNQSQKICEGMSRVLKVPVNSNLERRVQTETQTRKKRFQRWQNVQSGFIIRNPELLADKRILLVDDVFTTGATLEACCQVLKEIQGSRLGVATLAVAVH